MHEVTGIEMGGTVVKWGRKKFLGDGPRMGAIFTTVSLFIT